MVDMTPRSHSFAFLSGWRGNSSALLIALLALFLLHPLLDMTFSSHDLLIKIVTDILISVLWFVALYTVSRKNSTFIVAGLLLVPALISKLVFYAKNESVFLVVSHLSGFGLLVLVAAVILAHVLRAERITWNIIRGAICVYFVIGIAWASLFASIELLHPGSFRFPVMDTATANVINTDKQNFSWLLYYSFVTLTTVGYGDMSPVTPIARTLAVLEAILGQFYIGVLIARLMGFYILHSSQRDSE